MRVEERQLGREVARRGGRGGEGSRAKVGRGGRNRESVRDIELSAEER